MNNIKLTINGGLLTYIGWFIGTLPAVIFVGPFGVGFIDLVKSTFASPSGHTSETFLATVFVASLGFVVSFVVYQMITLILCPILVIILLRDYPQRRNMTALWLFLLLFLSPIWLLISWFTSMLLLGVAAAIGWSLLSPYVAWKLSARNRV